MVEVRLMSLDDVAAAEETWNAAISSLRSVHHLPPEPRTPDSVEAGRRKVAHLFTNDPGGSWVAENSGCVVAMAQSQIRGARWTLSNLGVHPNHQERGIGAELLARTMEYGARSPAKAIFSSQDPRAIHRYVRAGFTLHPAVAASGTLRKRTEVATSVREEGPEGLDHVDRVDSVVRGDARRQDIEFQLSVGFRILVSDGGYALVRDGRVGTLAAINEEVADRLLRAHLARCDPGQSVEVSWIRANDQWAIQSLSEGGVELRAHGAVMLRGDWEMDGAYLPSGVFG
jgi:ribosomal protein S18 acetylase RimI-like enzyme